MLNLTTYIIASFATYYLALSITREDGPFALFLALRNRFTNDTWVARGVRCLVCMSCWTALLFAVLLYLTWQYSDAAHLPIVWLGLAGTSVVIDRYWRR